jgi:hypothetical protein
MTVLRGKYSLLHTTQTKVASNRVKEKNRCHGCTERAVQWVHPQNVQLHYVQLQNVQLQNVQLQNVQLQNVQVTKGPGYQTSILQNVQITKRPGHQTSIFSKI